MKLSQLREAQVKKLCADWDEEDGTRPEKKRYRLKKDFKPLKLCRQAEKALAFEWDELTDRHITYGMAIERVTPEDNGSKLVLHVAYDARQYESDQIVLAVLKERRGYLRSIIAGMIHRKRVPELAFEVRPWKTDDQESEKGKASQIDEGFAAKARRDLATKSLCCFPLFSTSSASPAGGDDE